MSNWINKNKEFLIRLAFLIPILSVAAISISHVVSWYDLANPISWAIYLSIAVEIAAMSAIAASSVRVKGFSVWFVFIIVTLIQFIGNIYFSYTEIDVASQKFKDWSELTLPLFDSFSDTADLISQRRLLALLEGGLLPLISLTCLHFFIKYGDRDSEITVAPVIQEKVDPIVENEIPQVEEKTDEKVNEELVIEQIDDAQEEIKEEIPLIEDSVIIINPIPPVEETPIQEETVQVEPIQETPVKQIVSSPRITPKKIQQPPRVPVELTPRDIEGRTSFGPR